MKTVSCLVLIFCAVLAVNAVYLEGHDGRPQCNTEEEIQKEFWRNNNDPTTFWVCSKLYVPATSFQCPPLTAFLTSLRKCITWKQWQWEDPSNPPSMSY